MARTEIYVRYTGDKRWHCWDEIPRASAGALHLWCALEEKYLPSYENYNTYDGKPDYHTEECKRTGEYNHRWYYNMSFLNGDKSAMQEVWDLDHDPRLTYEEINVMRSTMDYAKVIGADLELFAECLEAVGNEHGGNYLEQAKSIKKLIASGKKISAIAYVQNSVCSATDFFGDNMCASMNHFWDCMVPLDLYNDCRKEIGLEQVLKKWPPTK